MGVFSCTPEFDLDFDLEIDWEMGEEEMLVDLIWSFELVDLAITFVFVLGFALVLGLVLILTVVVVLFDLVVWVFMGVRSSGSIFVSESVGDRGNWIPIASTISTSYNRRQDHQQERDENGDILNFDGDTISPFANTLINFSICSSLPSFWATSDWSFRTWIRREEVVVVFSYYQSLSSFFLLLRLFFIHPWFHHFPFVHSESSEMGEMRKGTYNFYFRHHWPVLYNLPYLLYFTQEIMIISPQIRSFDRHKPGVSPCIEQYPDGRMWKSNDVVVTDG